MNRFFATVAIALAAGIPAAAHAQTPASPVTLVLMGGAAMPMGDLDDIGDMGFTLGAGAEFGMSALPFGLRAELGYTRFGEVSQDFGDGSIAVRPSNLAVTINAIMGPSVPAAQIRPYFIAGVGFYNAKIDATIESPDFNLSGNESKAGVGLNGGAGIRFQFVGFSSFIEARYHHLFNGMIDLESEDEENPSWTSAGYLPIIFFAATVPTPMRAAAITLWVVLFPDNEGQMAAFGFVQHNFFILFNALIGVVFWRRAQRELFGS